MSDLLDRIAYWYSRAWCYVGGHQYMPAGNWNVCIRPACRGKEKVWTAPWPRKIGADMRMPGEPFCADCPDHEACATAYPCDVVRRVASEVEQP